MTGYLIALTTTAAGWVSVVLIGSFPDDFAGCVAAARALNESALRPVAVVSIVDTNATTVQIAPQPRATCVPVLPPSPEPIELPEPDGALVPGVGLLALLGRRRCR